MRIQWTDKARSDLARLHDFLKPLNPQAATRIVRALTVAPDHLLKHPRLGEKLDQFERRQVRRIIVGHYEVRYELVERKIYVLRIWHTYLDR